MVHSKVTTFGMGIAEVLRRNRRSLFGMEGEGEGSGTPPPSGEGSGTPPTPPANKEPETFDRKYVEELRSESASHRTKNKELEAELQKFKDAEAERAKAEMTEVERLKAEAAEKDQKIQAAEQALVNERKRNAVIAEASKLKFQDPEDALAYIDLEGLKLNEDGSVHKTSVESAVKKVADEKKYLLTGTGSADGGSRGTSPDLDAEKLRLIKQDLADRGAVPIPANTF